MPLTSIRTWPVERPRRVGGVRKSFAPAALGRGVLKLGTVTLSWPCRSLAPVLASSRLETVSTGVEESVTTRGPKRDPVTTTSPTVAASGELPAAASALARTGAHKASARTAVDALAQSFASCLARSVFMATPVAGEA